MITLRPSLPKRTQAPDFDDYSTGCQMAASAPSAGDGEGRRLLKLIFEETDVMDERTQFWMRSCLLGTAAAGMLVPGLLSGQTNGRSSDAKRSATARQPRPNSAGLIRPAGYEDTGEDLLVSQSEVEQRLRELYERDGREMPNMRLTTAPTAQPQATPASVSVPGQNGAPRALPTSQARYSTVPASQPAAKPQNRMTSFFKRLVPGSDNKKTYTQTPPTPVRPPQPIGTPQPIGQPAPVNSAGQVAAPQYHPPQQFSPATQSTTSGGPLSQPATIAPVNPSTAPNAAGAAAEFTPNITAPADAPIADESTAFPASTADDDDDEEMFDEPEFDAAEESLDIAPPVETAAPKLEDDFPNPFADEEAAPETPAEETNPYSGMTLDDADAPAELPSEPEIDAEISAADPTVDESTASKMRRIIQRADMKGLKGFCPVTLRDQRELADSRPEFVATHRGQKFFFASKDAQIKFEADGARYAPAAYGADVVVLTDNQDVVEGTLDHAAWFKGRLYLFGSQETHDIFVESPEKYASPPGIE